MEPVTSRSNHPGFDPRRSLPRGAFTLVELLGVIAIILILLTAVLPVVRGVMEGYAVTDCGQRLSGMIERARVHATATQRTVVLRFFPDPAEGVLTKGAASIGLLEIDPSQVPETDPLTGPKARLMDRVVRLQEPVLISWDHSSALQNPGLVSGTGKLPGSGDQPCLDLYIFPDGSNSLTGQSPNPYFTLLSSRDETDLRNPFVVSLDPLTTRVTIFRR